MTACFDALSVIATEDIAHILAASDDKDLTISYNTGKTERYDRTKTSDSTIISNIYNHIRQAQTEISEMMNDFEPTDEELDGMYQRYLAEKDSLGDAEDAILHHWA